MRALFGAASLVVALVVFYYAVIFTGQLPDHPLIRGFNDLVLHAGAFGLLTLIALPATSSPGVMLVGLSVFAALLEAAQLALPERTANLTDLGVSLAGISLAWLGLVAGKALVGRLSMRMARKSEKDDEPAW
jgi:VanZ family protein